MNGCVNPDRVLQTYARDGTGFRPTVSSLLRAAFPGRGRAKVAGREFGLHPDTVRHWASGRVVPGADRLLALAARSRPLRLVLLRALQEMEIEEASDG